MHFSGHPCLLQKSVVQHSSQRWIFSNCLFSKNCVRVCCPLRTWQIYVLIERLGKNQLQGRLSWFFWEISVSYITKTLPDLSCILSHNKETLAQLHRSRWNIAGNRKQSAINYKLDKNKLLSIRYNLFICFSSHLVNMKRSNFKWAQQIMYL